MAGRVCILLLIAGLFAVAVCNASRAEDLVQNAIKRRHLRREARELALLQRSKPRPRHHTPSVSSTNPQDKKALEDFYKSTEGATWVNSSGWMKGDPCQDGWYGIYCSSDGRVLDLSLVYNEVGGSIPESIASLTSLQQLTLYSNSIKGTLPSSLFSMSSLKTLDINNNVIRSTLPSSISMGNLTILNLYANNLFGNIPTTWDTPNLQTLSLSSNGFTGSFPPAIGKLTNLISLVLSHNQLSGDLPEEYGNLRNLEMLWLFNNDFTDMPKLPDSWSKLTSLTDVELDSISGEFPTWIGSWSQIFNLVMVDGKMTGSFPTSLCSLKKVQYLHIFNNSLSGPLPNCLCQLPQSLNSLELSDNDFSGSIPDCIGNLRNLTDLYLSRCNFSGNLPSTLGNIHYLNIVDFSSNSIVGSIPASYTGLKGGTFGFSLCYNKLSSFESGLDDFFKFIKGYTCALYENPWNCPVPSIVPSGCQATCSKCNTGNKQTSCSACIADSNCGWCSEGPNCLEGSGSGPDSVYRCGKTNWYYKSNCPNVFP